MNSAPSITLSFDAARAVPAALPSRAAQVLARCEAHFEKHRETWIAQRYTELLSEEGAQPAPRPSWAPAQDRASHLHRAATFMVERKQQMRVQKIHAAAQRAQGMQNSNDIER